jgi:NADPH:quinone reductase-like Zn-dependent oxidoreductase
MRKIVHHEIGEPARVLRLEEGAAPPLAPDQVRIRVSYAPIHPGDLLGVMGSPAFGSPPLIGHGGRVPGFEGAGVVTRLGSQVVYARPEGRHQGGLLPRGSRVERRGHCLGQLGHCRYR